MSPQPNIGYSRLAFSLANLTPARRRAYSAVRRDRSFNQQGESRSATHFADASRSMHAFRQRPATLQTFHFTKGVLTMAKKSAPERSSSRVPGSREEDAWLSDEQLAKCAPAETEPFQSPVPTRMVSNGEYMPHPQTRQQEHVEFRIKE